MRPQKANGRRCVRGYLRAEGGEPSHVKIYGHREDSGRGTPSGRVIWLNLSTGHL